MYRRSFLQVSAALLSSLVAKTGIASAKEQDSKSMASCLANELCQKSARALIELLSRKEISVLEVMNGHLQQIQRVNPVLNAICTLLPDQATQQARELDRSIAKGNMPGPLWGLPIAIKDLTLTKGIRTTLGSPIYSDFVPDIDALFVDRLKQAGAIIIGKTNAPEFGMGSHTFNQVFGITRNPYNPALTCGGSSGGAAVALATGMLPLADGSDMGGSLRNPAAWCNIVGFRPSPGRVPSWPSKVSSPLPVAGPMGRTVDDAALLLSVMAGPDERVALSIDEPGEKFLQPLQRDFRNTRIAWTADLGRYPVDPRVVDVCKNSISVFNDLGCEVDEAHPGLANVDEIFQNLRADFYARLAKTDYENHRDKMKDTAVWQIEKGLGLGEAEIALAEKQRLELVENTAKFFEKYDFLILPAVQVPPFPVETEWVREINGVPMQTYIDWMMICSAITVTGSPAISVPCGFTKEGLPIGLQIVGGPHRDFEVLQIARAYEQATRFGDKKPSFCSQS